MSDQPIPATGAVSAPRRGVLRFLFRTPLGLLLVVLGTLGLLLALAPTVASGFAPGLASDWFAERHRGRLGVEEAQLAWFGEQSLSGVELADPSGVRIARVDVRLPGLWALATGGGSRIGKVTVVAEAALSADASGRTNLDAALEPREASEDEPESERGASGSSGSSSLRDLEVELDLRLTRLSWSDERTRELGSPFVLEDVTLACVLRPGEPLSAKLRGTLSGGASGSLSLDARVEHPFEAPSSSTPPKADVSATIEHFPAALLDALARQGGRLQGLLGDEVSLSLAANGTVQQGTFDLRLDAPLAAVRCAARLDEGILRSEGEGLTAEFDLQPGFVEQAARPFLAIGASLTRPTDGAVPGAGVDQQRLGLAVGSFEAPVGAYLEASAKGDGGAALAALLSGVRARWTARLGDFEFTDPSLLPGRGPLSLRGLAVDGELAAPESESRISLAVTVRNAGPEDPAGAPGRLEWLATFQGGAAPAAFVPNAALAPVHVVASAKDWPTGLVDALAKADGDLSRALGTRLDADVDATISIEAAPETDLAWSTVAARWRELARRVRLDATLSLRGTPKGEALAALGGQVLSVRTVQASAKLAPGEPVLVRAESEFDTPAAGRFELTASLANALADAAAKAPLSFAVKAAASGLPSSAVGVLSGQGDTVEHALGRLLALDVDVQGTLGEGVARVELSSERTQIQLAGRLQGGVFVNLDGPALRVSLQPDARLLDGLLAGKLPEGTRIAFAESRGVVGVDVNFLSLPVQALLDAAAKSTDELLVTLLGRTRLEAVVGLREFVYEDATLAASGKRIDALAVQLGIRLTPGDALAPLALDVQATSPAFGPAPLDVHFEAPHAPRLLGVASGGGFEPLVLRAVFTDVPTALLDAYAGGALAGALGPKTSVEFAANLAQPETGPFTADAVLGLKGANGASTVTLAARAEDPLNVRAAPAQRRPAGVPPELEASLDVSGAGALLAFAPANARELLRELCGDTIAARFKIAATAADAARADVTLDAGAITLDGAADYTAGVLASVKERPIALRVTPTAAALQRALAGRLPEGASLVLAEQDGVLAVDVRQLSVPVGRFLAADPAVAKSELVANAGARLTVSLPTLVYTHPPAPPKAGETKAPERAVVTLQGVKVEASLTPAAPAKLDLTGTVAAEPPGAIEAQVVVVQPGGFLSEPPAAGSRATLTAKLARFPSALVDVLAQQDGLIVDVLGPELDATVRGAYPESAGDPVHAELHSSLGDVQLTSRIEGGVIVCEGEQGLDAKVGLTPLFSKRIIGSLVPLLVEVRQDDPLKRTLLTGRNLALPLDADMAKFSGELVLDLGAVDYQLLPGLTQALALGGVQAPVAKNTVVKPIAIKVVNGIARYDAIPIKIGGREVNFRGNADLVKQTFELGFAVPLELLGSKVESQLEKLRDVLDPKMEVPLELYGSWKSPRVRLGKGFLEKALKEAGAGALERGLGELLGGGKKKKKDG